MMTPIFLPGIMNAVSERCLTDAGDSQILRAVTDESPAQLPRIPQTIGGYEGP